MESTGLETFEKGKAALQTWRHFGLNWAFVHPKTPIRGGEKFCVCVKEFLPWVLMPLQVIYVNDSRNAKKGVASFGFGSGTLHGHLLLLKRSDCAYCPLRMIVYCLEFYRSGLHLSGQHPNLSGQHLQTAAANRNINSASA
ncbi:hypothetical protein HS088_TW06G00609 [Tripterygium wilfordii]|uniref:DUF1990 domain-containing protein n=1 Tax=Tripterygium wilfordii TaxID=458696 RepID=A0A7J7DJF6_TRIWF|nr:hypothetical protein HS088_TW06G00609 [Tripterygium wilfordii]